ncbi:MAG: hypothetical protein NVS2B12_02790 [Ktedonobacteraceae bacterium]
MRLEDTLKICLLALESRYPEHVVDINQDILNIPDSSALGWTASEIITYLEQTHPARLYEMARLVIDLQCSEIYLLEVSERAPAFLVHCRGKIPHRARRTVSIRG